jgi:hypothetical protein
MTYIDRLYRAGERPAVHWLSIQPLSAALCIQNAAGATLYMFEMFRELS